MMIYLINKKSKTIIIEKHFFLTFIYKQGYFSFIYRKEAISTKVIKKYVGISKRGGGGGFLVY